VTGFIGNVLIAGQSMADQHRIRLCGIQLAIGLVGDLEGREIDARLEPQRLVRAEAHHGTGEVIRLVSSIPLGARNGHVTPLSAGCAQAQKPALPYRKMPVGFPQRPFSDLFNVAASRPAKSPRVQRSSTL
jgi:hypothetical protein